MAGVADRWLRVAVLSGICAVVALVFLPVSAADPQFPNLSGYSAVNAEDFETYATYGIKGVQFAAPGGYRCRIGINFRVSRQMADCWGALPGTARNHVGVITQSKQTTAAELSDVNLSLMEQYDFRPAEGPAGVIDPKDYKPLPPNNKISFGGFTCGVDPISTACESDDPSSHHGFFLSPQGSWTF
jgi:hypothetical protein